MPCSGHVDIYVTDIMGRKIVSIYSGFVEEEAQTISWNGLNESGELVASGVYFVTILTNEFKKAIKVGYIK